MHRQNNKKHVKLFTLREFPPRRRQTLRAWRRSVRNFGKTRFGRFAIFDFLTPKKFFRKKCSVDFFFLEFFFGFSLFSSDFGGSGDFWTSKSASRRYFASDGQIFRSVGRLEWSQRGGGGKSRNFSGGERNLGKKQ